MSMFRSRTVAVEDVETFHSLENGGQTENVAVARTNDGNIYLFKRYSDDALKEIKPHVLDHLVCWRNELSENDRRILDERAAWIRHVVVDHKGSVVGALMPLAERGFWFLDKNGKTRPREGGCLYAAHVDEKRENFPRSTRYVVLAGLLETITWFHKAGIAIGDLQPRNFLVSRNLSILLIDTDSFWIDGECAFPTTENELYKAPTSGESHGTSLRIATDLFKFALIACKAMSENGAVRDTEHCESYMTTEQCENIKIMLACQPVKPANISQLIKQWSRCVFGYEHYEYSVLLLTRKYVDGNSFRLRQGELPEVKVASAARSQLSVKSNSGSGSNVTTTSLPSTSVSGASLTPVSYSRPSKRKWPKWLAIILVVVILYLVSWHDAGYFPELSPLFENISGVFDGFVSWLQTLWP